MLNKIWLGMIFLAILTGVLLGRIDEVVQAVTNSAKMGFEIALGLTGIMAFWLGLMNIAAEAGLVKRLANWMNPVLRPLFPDVPPNDPAMGAMVMNMAANMLGLGNAATPFGLQAMKALQRLQKESEVASDAMCTFLAINTSSIQLIPITSIAFLAANGSSHPHSVIVSSLFATIISTMVGIIAVKLLARLSIYRLNPVLEQEEGS